MVQIPQVGKQGPGVSKQGWAGKTFWRSVKGHTATSTGYRSRRISRKPSLATGRSAKMPAQAVASRQQGPG